ncbi:MAG: shikimate kinase [Candidatus Nanopelagicales bacterium]|nr:shikimate kinase [Candidatus Nanopelagicales bacterium]
MSPAVVLVGAPGAGKTTVGDALATRLGVPFADTDRLIELAEGQTVGDIFIQSGEDHFRERERAVVRQALVEQVGVVALGGGAVMDPDLRAELANITTVWLRVTSDVAASRVGLNAARPVLLGNVRGRMVSLLKERVPLYEEVANIAVDTDELAIDDVVQAIIDGLALEDQ